MKWAEKKWAKAGESLTTRRLYSVLGCKWIKDCRLLFHHDLFFCVMGYIWVIILLLVHQDLNKLEWRSEVEGK